MAAPLAKPDPRIPVTIVTGFLGSGKTTLLSNLLRRAHGERIAVIINEFGEVPLDQAFIDAAGGKAVTVAGGCLCCAIAGDIVTTLRALHESRSERAFDRVVIETSGLADPGPISADLLDAPELTQLFRLEGVVCVVDALQGLLEFDRQRISVKQVAMADRLVLTKSDIASPHAIPRLLERLAAINPSAPLTVANYGDVDPGWLLRPVEEHGRWPQAMDQEGHSHHGHNHGIRASCLWFEQPLDREAFWRAMATLTDTHGERLLRIKGLLNLSGEPRPVAIHGVGRFLHPLEPLADWPGADRRSRVVFIADRLGEAEIAPFFESLAPRPLKSEPHPEFEQAVQ
jgi:G3E family GTPase